jgi:hypothetical protein
VGFFFLRREQPEMATAAIRARTTADRDQGLDNTKDHLKA